MKKEAEEKISQKESLSEEVLEVKKKPDTLISKPEIQKKEKTDLMNLKKPLILTIKVKNNSWFNLTIDDSSEEDFILAAGDEKIFNGNKVFRLTIGNKHGTDIILNGKSLVLPESPESTIKDFIINSKLIE